MRTKKYILCSGLAFGDYEDMEMLHIYAKKGWIFREFKLGAYVLHKEEPMDVIFNYDLQKLKKEDISEYLMIYERSGWKLVDHSSEYYFFVAPNGTVNLHTDQMTRDQQFRTAFFMGLIAFLLGVLLQIICLMVSTAWRVNLAAIGGALIGSGGFLAVGCYARMKGKRIRADFTKVRANIVILLLGISIFGISVYTGFLKNSGRISMLEIMVAFAGIILFMVGVLGCKRSLEYKRWKKEVQFQEEMKHD